MQNSPPLSTSLLPHLAFALLGLSSAAPRTIVHEKTRFVDNGTIITTAGISAGIDGSLHLVSRLLGAQAAEDVAQYMEYDKWMPNAGLIVNREAAVP